jgi:Ras-related protein Rab-5C
MVPCYLRDADAVAIVYECDDRQSLTNAAVWLARVKSHTPPGCIYALIENKIDLDVGPPQMQSETGRLFAEGNGMLFFRTSAYTGEGAGEAYADIVEAMCAQFASAPVADIDPDAPCSCLCPGCRGGKCF